MSRTACVCAQISSHLHAYPASLVFAYTRMRGDTIVSLELTKIGINNRTQNQIRFAMKLMFENARRNTRSHGPFNDR
jgi:hypothetical protein